MPSWHYGCMLYGVPVLVRLYAAMHAGIWEDLGGCVCTAVLLPSKISNT